MASEHNVVADLEPIVRELHLERALVSIPGDELTSDASRHPWGHANAWPLPVDASDPRGGAPAVRDRTPREVFDELRPSSAGRLRPPGRTTLASGQNGYFDQLGFDPTTGVGTDPGYDAALRRARGLERAQRRSARQGARRLLRAPAHGPSGDGDGGHRHARHRRAGGRLPADVRARGGRRSPRSVDPGADGRRRARRQGAARRRADERTDAARDRRRRAHRRRRRGAHRRREGSRRERAVDRGRRAPPHPGLRARRRTTRP